MSADEVTYIYVDMNSYFASVEQQLDPSLRGRPVGIVTIASGNAACIAASYEAKKLGIGMGVRMQDAKRMAPDIAFRAARHDVYVHYHHKIKDAIERVYPVEATHSIDEFSCRLLGNDRKLIQAQILAEKIRQAIYDYAGEALRCSIGLGQSLLLAKLAGELKKPAGLEWLLPQEMPHKIAHLSLSDIPGIGKNMAQRLHYSGIHNIKQLYAMQPKHAAKIWRSINGERFLMALQGHDVPAGKTYAHSLGHGQILSPDNRTPNNARLVARRLLIKAATRLRRSGNFASSLYIGVKCDVKGRCGVQQKMAYTQDSFRLLTLFAQMWSTLRPVQPVSVSVMLGGLTTPDEHMSDLFDVHQKPGTQTAREKLCSIVDQLNQQHGQDTIVYGERPHTIAPYTGAKIAFGRIPTAEEFRD